jgi:hypothetical protein
MDNAGRPRSGAYSEFRSAGFRNTFDPRARTSTRQRPGLEVKLIIDIIRVRASATG